LVIALPDEPFAPQRAATIFRGLALRDQFLALRQIRQQNIAVVRRWYCRPFNGT